MLKKELYIAKYGEEAWKRAYESCKRSKLKTRKHQTELMNEWRRKHNAIGYTRYCRKNYELIENYELAKADNFDAKKWVLHHKLENFWSSTTLQKKHLYWNVNPEALIWLPTDEHRADTYISQKHPEKSKWHQRKLEHE